MRRLFRAGATIGPLTAALTVVAAALLAPLVLASTAAAAPCSPQPTATEVPWAQRVLDPERVWSYATGRGVTVAVIDSGVDTTHPQMFGSIADQHNMIAPQPNNCTSHGTEVASLINAQPAPGVGFNGLAPGARVLPIRVSDRGDDGLADSDPAVFADAIRWAADRADVINISMVMHTPDERVRSAVAAAVAKDVVVVAAAGNDHREDGPDPPSYPASYPGVLGVGAVAADGSRLPQSQVGPSVDVVAPGADVVVAYPGGGHRVVSGTSYATAFVAATAALVRQARPGLHASDVINRIIATATPTHGGPGFGGGLVNPYQAVTEEALFVNPRVTLPAAPEASVDPLMAEEQLRWRRLTRAAVLISIGLLGLVWAAGVGAVVVRRGRARGWAPGRVCTPSPPARGANNSHDANSSHGANSSPR